MKRFAIWALATIVALAGVIYVAVQVSPWPSALAIRYVFNQAGESLDASMARHVPPAVAGERDLTYGSGPDETFDVFYPEGTSEPLPTIVWVHGGGWVSGSKDQVSNYLRILAGHGYTAVGLDYSIAPEATYPVPIHQVNAALAHLTTNSGQYNIDPARIVLAGDSAGSQIAAQVANIVTSPAYADLVGVDPAIEARQLRTILLFCGAYDLSMIDLDGNFGWFLHTVLWAYSGVRDFRDDPQLKQASVVDYVTADFPTAFITGGNNDPLTPQSRELARRLDALGVEVDTLFYSADHNPALPHEYQFNLDNRDGQAALEQTLAFLEAVLAAS